MGSGSVFIKTKKFAENMFFLQGGIKATANHVCSILSDENQTCVSALLSRW